MSSEPGEKQALNEDPPDAYGEELNYGYAVDENNGLVKQKVVPEKLKIKTIIQLGSVFFSTYASIGVIVSFLSLFLKELGLTPLMIGCVSCCRPIGGFIAGFVSPILVDKFPSQRSALFCSAVIFLVAIFSLRFVPALKHTPECSYKLDNGSVYQTFPTIGRNISEPFVIENGELMNNGNLSNNQNFRNLSNVSISTQVPNASLDFKSQLQNETGLPREFRNTSDTFQTHSSFPDSHIPIFEINTAVILTAILIGVLVFIGEYQFITLDTISHGITMTTLGKGNSQSYGVIRAWGAIGHGVGAIATGVTVTLSVHEVVICGRKENQAEYRYMFYVFLTSAILICLTIFGIDKDMMKSAGDKTHKMTILDLQDALGTPRNMSWLIVIICRSMFYAVTQGFLYWHMENIGASPILIGIANGITTTTEFLMFFVTPKLIERFGHMNIVSVGIFSYVVRFIIFSFIQNPYYILPVEVLEGIMYACIWSSIISYLSNQVSQSHQTQIQGLVQSLYMFGAALGFLMSGALTQIFGTSIMFQVFAGIASVTLIFFIAIHKIF